MRLDARPADPVVPLLVDVIEALDATLVVVLDVSSPALVVALLEADEARWLTVLLWLAPSEFEGSTLSEPQATTHAANPTAITKSRWMVFTGDSDAVRSAAIATTDAWSKTRELALAVRRKDPPDNRR